MVRPAFPIRLLALDIDGTLVGDNLALRDRTVAAGMGSSCPDALFETSSIVPPLNVEPSVE